MNFAETYEQTQTWCNEHDCRFYLGWHKPSGEFMPEPVYTCDISSYSNVCQTPSAINTDPCVAMTEAVSKAEKLLNIKRS